MTGAADAHAARSVLMLHGGALGDCALTLHIARAIQSQHPSRRLTLAARSPLAKWAHRAGLVADALDLDAIDAWHVQADGRPSARCIASLTPFDLVISFLGGEDEPVSRNLRAAAECPVITIDPRPDAVTLATGRHITAQWSASMAAAGFPLRALDAPAARLAPPTGPTIVHPGSGGVAKCAPVEAWAAVVSVLRQAGHDVAWMIGPAEVERRGAGYAAQLARSAPVVFEERVEAAAGVVTSARAFLGHDAGMTHVAALCGVATVAVFGPTDPRVWRPLGPRVAVERFPAGDDYTDFAARVVRALHRAEEGG
jgi:ADP-heptose:LPS heptosyltransferase